MAINVIFDPTLQKEEILIPLTDTSVDESGDYALRHRNQSGYMQTSIYGIQAPLIQINSIPVDFTDVIEFSLKSVGVLPSVSMTIKDRYDLIKSFDIPGNDNKVIVQILPKFDDAYKKINLIFYISSLNINKNFITLTGIYKLPSFLSSNIKSFGKISTFELCEKIAIETGLGFASNAENDDIDKRYIYCDNKSYDELLNKEIKFSSGSGLEVFEHWVDFWDYLNYADVQSLYKNILPEIHDDMQIWVASNPYEVEEGKTVGIHKTPAVITNNFTVQNTELYTSSYRIINKSGNYAYMGTDKLYSIYNMDTKDYLDTLILDSDVNKDVFTKLEYTGEIYGDYDYLLASKKREKFLQKVGTEVIEVTMNTPLLALQRGRKVNFIWYKNDTYYDINKKVLEEGGFINKNEKINIPENEITDFETDDIEGANETKLQIDRNISGQYVIVGCNIKFYNGGWNYILTLSKYASDKISQLS